MKNPYEPILKEIAIGLLETAETKQNFSNDALVDALLIFQTVLFDKAFDNGINEEAATKLGNELRKLIHTYTGLDTVKLVDDYGK